MHAYYSSRPGEVLELALLIAGFNAVISMPVSNIIGPSKSDGLLYCRPDDVRIQPSDANPGQFVTSLGEIMPGALAKQIFNGRPHIPLSVFERQRNLISETKPPIPYATLRVGGLVERRASPSNRPIEAATRKLIHRSQRETAEARDAEDEDSSISLAQVYQVLHDEEVGAVDVENKKKWSQLPGHRDPTAATTALKPGVPNAAAPSSTAAQRRNPHLRDPTWARRHRRPRREEPVPVFYLTAQVVPLHGGVAIWIWHQLPDRLSRHISISSRGSEDIS